MHFFAIHAPRFHIFNIIYSHRNTWTHLIILLILFCILFPVVLSVSLIERKDHQISFFYVVLKLGSYVTFLKFSSEYIYISLHKVVYQKPYQKYIHKNYYILRRHLVRVYGTEKGWIRHSKLSVIYKYSTVQNSTKFGFSFKKLFHFVSSSLKLYLFISHKLTKTWVKNL